MKGVRSGSQEAAWRLIDLYAGHIRRVVGQIPLIVGFGLGFDSVDFVQLVWASFFRQPAQTLSFETSNDLACYLAIIARNKVIDEGRRSVGTRKHNVTRTRSVGDLDILPIRPVRRRRADAE